MRRGCRALGTVRNDPHQLGSSRDTWPLVSRPTGGPVKLLGPWLFPVGFLSMSSDSMGHGNIASAVLVPRMRLDLSAHCIASCRVVSHCVHQLSNRWLTKVMLIRYGSSIYEGDARWIWRRSAITTRGKSWWKQVTEWKAG